jgi:hypothetical protein
MVSLPPMPQMTSSDEVPVRVSPLGVPVIVQLADDPLSTTV